MNKLALTPGQRAKVRELVADGLSLRLLAERFRCSKTTIFNALHGRHSTGARYLDAEAVFEVLCAYNEPIEEVARRHGLSEYAVGRVHCLASATSKAVWRERRAEIEARWREVES